MAYGQTWTAPNDCYLLSEIQKSSSSTTSNFAVLEEKDRKGLLFAITLHTSMISNSASAVERLAQSNNLAEFNEDIYY